LLFVGEMAKSPAIQANLVHEVAVRVENAGQLREFNRPCLWCDLRKVSSGGTRVFRKRVVWPSPRAAGRCPRQSATRRVSGSGGLGSGCCALKENIQPRQPGWRLGPFRVFVTLWKPPPLFSQGSLKCAKFSCARKMANQGALQGVADGNDCPFPEARTTGCVLAAWGAGTAEHHGLHLLGNRCWSRGHPRLGQLVGAEC
jgi:hypothetical protein